MPSVGFDTSQGTADGYSNASYSTTITVGNNPNRCLIIMVGIESIATSVSGVTVNGSAATLINSVSNGGVKVFSYYFLNPSVGSNIVTVTFDQKGYTQFDVGSFYNVDQSSPIGNKTTSTTTSLSLTSSKTGSMMMDGAIAYRSATATGANQTLLINMDYGDYSYTPTPTTSGNSITMNYGGGTLTGPANSLVEINPFTTIVKLLTESITHSDAILRNIWKTMIENITHSDIFINLLILKKVLSENISHLDTLLRNIFIIKSENVTHTDMMNRGIFKTMIETVTHTDTFQNLLSLYLKLTDQIIHNDKLNWTAILKFKETITHSDLISSLLTIYKKLTETITHSDVFNGLLSIVVKLTETIRHLDHLFLNGLLSIWTKRIKPITSWLGRTKPTTNWTKRTRP